MSSGGGGGGGGGGPIQQATAPTVPGAAYTPAKQGPVYQPQYQQYQQYQPQQTAPQQQQVQMPSYQSGLQAAMMQMMRQYNRPMMRAPLQQGLTPSSPLAYRPPAVNNTSRVAPSVELQQRLDAEAKAKWDAEHPSAPVDNGPSWYGSTA